jgi:hypothetical protein
MNSDLDSLTRSYTRLSRDVGGRIEFACDLDSADALTVAEREKDHPDQAFFVLSFSALEKKITLLASARQATADQRTAPLARSARRCQKAACTSRFSPIRLPGTKTPFEGSIARKWVYNLGGRKAKESIPAKGGEERCLAIGVGS